MRGSVVRAIGRILPTALLPNCPLPSSCARPEQEVVRGGSSFHLKLPIDDVEKCVTRGVKWHRHSCLCRSRPEPLGAVGGRVAGKPRDVRRP